MSKRSTFNLRRGLLAAGLALPFAAPGRVLAQGTYPDKPLKLVIPFAAGGAIDVLGRTFASRLSEELKQQIVVDNRAGATGHVGSEYVARSPADGYTLLFTPSSTQVVSPHVLNLRYKPMEDLVPVTLAATVPNLVVVNAALPATTLQEFIDYARARPGQLSYASWGIGSNLHLATELLSLQSGLKMVHVPYSAPTLVQDLVAGRVQFHIGNIVELESFIRTGQVRLLAVTGPERLPAFPNAPTVAERIPGYVVRSWGMLMAPARTSPEVLARLNAASVRALASPELREAFEKLRFTPAPLSLERTAEFLRADNDLWGRAVRDANVRLNN